MPSSVQVQPLYSLRFASLVIDIIALVLDSQDGEQSLRSCSILHEVAIAVQLMMGASPATATVAAALGKAHAQAMSILA